MGDEPEPTPLAPDAESATDELLRQFAAGDPSALGRLVERETPWLLKRLHRKLPAQLRQRVGASDVVQATAMDLIAVRDRFENRGVRAFRRMLAVIADQNLARVIEREFTQKRDAGCEVRAAGPWSEPLIERVAGHGTSPSEKLMRVERSELLSECFRFLGEPYRDIIRRVDFEEQSYEQVADDLAITVEAARKRHSRGLGQLRRLLDRAERSTRASLRSEDPAIEGESGTSSPGMAQE